MTAIETVDHTHLSVKIVCSYWIAHRLTQDKNRGSNGASKNLKDLIRLWPYHFYGLITSGDKRQLIYY